MVVPVALPLSSQGAPLEMRRWMSTVQTWPAGSAEKSALACTQLSAASRVRAGVGVGVLAMIEAGPQAMLIGMRAPSVQSADEGVADGDRGPGRGDRELRGERQRLAGGPVQAGH